MTVDLTKLILDTPYNSFKNVNKYLGTLSFATSVLAGATLAPTTNIILTDTPVFTAFYCNFLENIDATFGVGSAQWYNIGAASAVNPNIGILITGPAPHVNEWSGCTVYPVINGNTLTVTGNFHNPYAVNLTLQALSVPFVFIEYTLAN